MPSPEFVGWPKIYRLNRDVVITEKLDGTNAAVVITDDGIYAQSRTRVLPDDADNFGFRQWVEQNADALRYALGEGVHFGEWWGKGIQRGYGLDHRRFSLFNTSRWVIQTPGEPDKLDPKLAEVKANGLNIDVVPILYRGPLMNVVGYKDDDGKWSVTSEQKVINEEVEHMYEKIEELTGHNLREILMAPGYKYTNRNPRLRFVPAFLIEWLKRDGSVAVPGFKAEGIVVFHYASGQMFKATCEKDEQHKGA